MSLIPPYLKVGDTVVIIATARKISDEELNPTINILNSWGLRAELAPNLFKSHHQFSGSDEERTEDLQWALNHKTAKAILIARGGYGTLRIIDNVDFTEFKKNPKWLIGYSDVTVLHSHLQSIGIVSLHATMPVNFLKHEDATLSIRQLLFNEQIDYAIPCHPLNKPGKAEAEVIGGNLSLLYALSGSASEVDFTNKILFIEDLDEFLYHIDRMMLQLKRSGKLKNLAGLIVGGMSEMKDNSISFGKNAEEIIHDAVSEYNYPVCFNFPAGHIDENMALYLGKPGHLEVTKNNVKFYYLQHELQNN
ncbi:MAG TPA: LD-carboxypeptidase [Bacteroidia bacterium]|nr:LD-carboxypeptidase [Bacteroidia bacterium]